MARQDLTAPYAYRRVPLAPPARIRPTAAAAGRDGEGAGVTAARLLRGAPTPRRVYSAATASVVMTTGGSADFVSGFLPRIQETAAPDTAISAAAVKTIMRP